MTEVILRYRASRFAGERGLYPVDPEGETLFRALKADRDVGADVKRRRNPRHHRLFFAILNFIRTHCDRFELAAIDDVKDSIKIATGLTQKRIDVETGKIFYVVKSISWAAMDQTRFNQFFEDACRVIAERWMPAGTTPEAVRQELIEMVDGPHAIGEHVA